MNLNIFDGTITALITPFKQGNIDFASLESLIDRQIDSGINGIVIGGSTGEGSSITGDQHFELVKAASEYVGNKVNIFLSKTWVLLSLKPDEYG